MDREVAVEIYIERDVASVSDRAAMIVAQVVRRNPSAVLGLATGSTPLGLYGRLVEMNGTGHLDFSNTTTFNLDDYYGIATTHPASYRTFMEEHFFSRLTSRPRNTFVPDSTIPNNDIRAYCDRYESLILEAGGIDLQVLGIGSNGHIAYNEPGSSFGSRTRVEVLADETIDDNSRFFASRDEVPRLAITMGIATILGARCCLLLASGESKAKAIAAGLEGPITCSMPASALQLHPNVVCVVDHNAGALLQRADYNKRKASLHESLATSLSPKQPISR